jgi:hypothetical protein
LLEYTNFKEYPEVLIRLGLTQNEAKVFLAIHDTHTPTAKFIAKNQAFQEK